MSNKKKKEIKNTALLPYAVALETNEEENEKQDKNIMEFEG